MERITVELDPPRDLLGVLLVTEDELGPDLKLLIALELFREEKISSGKAAEVVGLSKSAFIALFLRDAGGTGGAGGSGGSLETRRRSSLTGE